MPAGDVERGDTYIPPSPPTSGSGSVGGLNLGSGAPTPSTTSSGGSSGSGTSRAATNRSALVTLRRYFTNLGLGSGLATWAYGLLKKGYDMEGVMAELYGRPEFKKRFQGIFRKDGSLIVSPQEYIQLGDAYQSIAAQYGFKLSSGDIGKIINGENSPEEWKIKARAVQVINSNRDVFRDMGFKSAKDAYKFVIGKADKDVYDRYEAAAIRTSLRQAGVGGDAAGVTGARALQLARQTGGVLDFEDIAQRAAKIREQVITAGPELLGFGISNRDLEDVQFGRPTSGVLARVERALSQRQATIENAEAASRGYGPEQTQEGPAPTGYRRQAGA